MTNSNVPAINPTDVLNGLTLPPPEKYEVPQLSYLYGYWRGGDQKLAPLGLKHPLYVGGFSFSAEKLDAAPANFISIQIPGGANGKFTEWCSPIIEVAVITSRQSFYDAKTKQHFAAFDLAHVKERRSKTEVLCFVRGIDTPVVLSAKGFNAGNLQGACNQGYQAIKLTIKSEFPPYAFFIPIGGEVDGAGNPVFRTVGKTTQNTILPIKFRPDGPLTGSWLLAHRADQATVDKCASFTKAMVAEWKAARFVQGNANLQDSPEPEVEAPEEPPFE